MNNRQINKYNAAVTGIGIMNAFFAIWSGFLAIVNKVSAVSGNITKIEEWEAKQELDITGNAVAKKIVKSNGAYKAWVIAKPLTTYALDIKDLVLKKEIDFEHTDLLQVSDAKAIERWQLVHDRADTHISALTTGGYPITPLDITELAGFITDFSAIKNNPQVAKAITVAATAELEKQFTGLSKNIPKLLDIIAPFAKSESEFYNATIDGFEIIDAGTRHQALRATLLDDVTGVRLGKVKCTIEELVIFKNSSKRGIASFSQQVVENGNYTLSFEKPNYVKQTISNVGVEHGILTRLVVRMVKVS